MALHLVPDAINDYAEAMTTPENDVLKRLNRETYLKVAGPNMLSGHLQGAILSMISKMIRPAAILEIGTFTGYSAICLAEGLAKNGRLDTLDINEELGDLCARYWDEAGLTGTITQHIGMAAAIIPGLNHQYDLVFIDADKVNYSLYYSLVFDKVPVGGYILADNVLYHGEVVLPESEQSKNANAMDEFNKLVSGDSRVEQVLLPVRDGLLLMRKISQ